MQYRLRRAVSFFPFFFSRTGALCVELGTHAKLCEYYSCKLYFVNNRQANAIVLQRWFKLGLTASFEIANQLFISL
jgi:hypothetical protein